MPNKIYLRIYPAWPKKYALIPLTDAKEGTSVPLTSIYNIRYGSFERKGKLRFKETLRRLIDGIGPIGSNGY